jgi:DNA-binding CsgD family transcriptional regulator
MTRLGYTFNNDGFHRNAVGRAGIGAPSVNPHELAKIGRHLGAAALDPQMWVEVMEDICRATRTNGAILLQSDIQTPDVPHTAGVHELAGAYFADGWHLRDVRLRTVPQLLAGEPVVLDQDIPNLDDSDAQFYYNEFLKYHGFWWFAGIGFKAGSSLWALALQRTVKEGSFTTEDKSIFAKLSPSLTHAATLSTAVGRTVVSGMTDALGLVRQPALVLDRMGIALDFNAAAEALFDDDIRVINRRLLLGDSKASAQLDAVIGNLRTTPETPGFPSASIVIRRKLRASVLCRILPVPPAAAGPFLGARALLTFSEVQRAPSPAPILIAAAFALTPAEARLAALLAQGMAPAEAARRLGISRETARNQLKAIFNKTGTHRQAELVALLSKLQ